MELCTNFLSVQVLLNDLNFVTDFITSLKKAVFCSLFEPFFDDADKGDGVTGLLNSENVLLGGVLKPENDDDERF